MNVSCNLACKFVVLKFGPEYMIFARFWHNLLVLWGFINDNGLRDAKFNRFIGCHVCVAHCHLQIPTTPNVKQTVPKFDQNCVVWTGLSMVNFFSFVLDEFRWESDKVTVVTDKKIRLRFLFLSEKFLKFVLSLGVDAGYWKSDFGPSESTDF